MERALGRATKNAIATYKTYKTYKTYHTYKTYPTYKNPTKKTSIKMKQQNKSQLALVFSFIFYLLAVSPAGAQTPAFPGAEGHGRYVSGGRGGKLVHVTNLNDSGTGSFRQAVKGSDKKIVVFDVGGVIALKSDVSIGANTTIEGQTAPEPGITLRYYTVSPAGNNIIMRFIRVRRGQEKNINDGADACWARHYTGIIIDHCSFSWSIDEVASFYDNNNFTMQWCTIGESLNNAGHNKGAHGYGGIWGGKLASFHHNLICHVNNRSPRFNGARYDWAGYTSNKLYSEYNWQNAVQAENVDFRNCVVYNCGNGCYGGPGGGQVNMVGNYYKTGPAGSTTLLTTVSTANSTTSSDNATYLGMTSRYYLEGNQINSNTGKDWSWMKYDDDDNIITVNGERYSYDNNHYNGNSVTYTKSNGKDYVRIRLDEPAPYGEVTTHKAATAFTKVLNLAGASLCRDNVDERYCNEATKGTATYSGSVTGKPGRIDLVSDVNGYTENNFGTGSRPADFDTDRDGISDAWEQANGLNPNDATDAGKRSLDPTGYYTNLEVYLNSLVQDIMLDGNDGAETALKEYYPAYTTEDGVKVEAVNMPDIDDKEVTITLSDDTNIGSNTNSTYNFDNDFTITNKSGKGYAKGNGSYIKFSAAVQYTINVPSGLSINSATFTGYDNYTDTDSYLGEVNGTEYGATYYVFPKSKDVVSHTVNFSPAARNTITFTPQGKQTVLAITLSATKGSSAGIINAATPVTAAKTACNLAGQKVEKSYKGIVVVDSKKLLRK